MMHPSNSGVFILGSTTEQDFTDFSLSVPALIIYAWAFKARPGVATHFRFLFKKGTGVCWKKLMVWIKEHTANRAF